MLLLVPKSQSLLPPTVASLLTPSNGAIPGDMYAVDNEAFVGFNEPKFLKLLDRVRPLPGRLFTVAPDVVADSEATLALWRHWQPIIDPPVAFVAQDGCTDIPDDADALFVGGTTEWKLSPAARALVNGFDGWTQRGRVNSVRRLKVAMSWGADSVDGSGMARFPDAMLPRMIRTADAPTQLAIL